MEQIRQDTAGNLSKYFKITVDRVMVTHGEQDLSAPNANYQRMEKNTSSKGKAGGTGQGAQGVGDLGSAGLSCRDEGSPSSFP